MLNVLNVEQARCAEKDAMSRGMDAMYLSMNAALALADAVYPRASRTGVKTAVFCGPGGNGGDGMLAAIRLFKRGCDVTIYTVGTGKSEMYKTIAEYVKCERVPTRPASEYVGGASVVIDAIYGIGLNKPICGETATLIERLNGEESLRIAVDIPSGIHGDTGEKLGVAFRADVTVTFSCYKLGMLFGDGRSCCGKIDVENIGITADSDLFVYSDGDFDPHRRDASAHKGKFGKVFVIGGCGTMIGAPILAGAAAHAAYLNGAGTVTVCVPSVHRNALGARSTMSMMKFMRDTADGFIVFDKAELDEILSTATAIDIGSGMGNTPELRKIIEYINAEFDGTLVIDADGLNCFGTDITVLKGGRAKIAITPHVGEFRRLAGKEPTVETAKELAEKTGAVVVAKSATTIITDGERTVLNVSGTPAMAKGGTGDVLGGCITALSCSYPLFDAAVVACYRNGLGAERAVSSYAEMMLTPRDILSYAEYKETED